MNDLFPLGLPWTTSRYVVLYVVTLAVHAAFMNYLLAGSAYLGLTGLVRATGANRPESRIRQVLRDWLPFSAGAAVTAGVAPLLFVQVLYPGRFYTANLLLSHRWMLIVPAVIAGVYLLYLLKARFAATWRWGVRAALGLGAVLCFAFTGMSWTENHLLSVNASAWPGFYASGSMVYLCVKTVPRFLVWSMGAFSTLALLLGWQMLPTRRSPEPPTEADWRRLAGLALAGLALGGAAALGYGAMLDEPARKALLGPVAGPYVAAAAFGAVIQATAWLAQLRGGFNRAWMTVASLGLALTLLSMTTAREAVRIAEIDVEVLLARHAQAAAVGGFWVFVVFLVANAALIAVAIRTARRALPHSSGA